MGAVAALALTAPGADHDSAPLVDYCDHIFNIVTLFYIIFIFIYILLIFN